MASRKYFSGVLPFAVHDKVVYFLLGRESRGKDRGTWSGFAGRYDQPGETTLHLACREANEESMGLLGSERDICRAIQAHGTRLDVSRGTHFVVPIAYDASLPRVFHARRARMLSEAPAYQTEKDMLAWVPAAGPAPSHLPIRPGFVRDFQSIRAALAGAK